MYTDHSHRLLAIQLRLPRVCSWSLQLAQDSSLIRDHMDTRMDRLEVPHHFPRLSWFVCDGKWLCRESNLRFQFGFWWQIEVGSTTTFPQRWRPQQKVRHWKLSKLSSKLSVERPLSYTFGNKRNNHDKVQHKASILKLLQREDSRWLQRIGTIWNEHGCHDLHSCWDKRSDGPRWK